jgi:hypothetical protein
MVQSAEEQVLNEGFLSRDSWVKGLEDIASIPTLPEGSFFYTWFKGLGIKPC